MPDTERTEDEILIEKAERELKAKYWCKIWAMAKLRTVFPERELDDVTFDQVLDLVAEYNKERGKWPEGESGDDNKHTCKDPDAIELNPPTCLACENEEER